MGRGGARGGGGVGGLGGLLLNPQVLSIFSNLCVPAWSPGCCLIARGGQGGFWWFQGLLLAFQLLVTLSLCFTPALCNCSPWALLLSTHALS